MAKKYEQNSFTMSMITLTVLGVGSYFLYRYLVDNGYIKPISLLGSGGIIPGYSYTQPTQQAELIILLKQAPTQSMVDQLQFMIPQFNQTAHIQQIQSGKDIIYGKTVRVPINYVPGKTEQFIRDLSAVSFVQSARISGVPTTTATTTGQVLYTGQSS